MIVLSGTGKEEALGRIRDHITVNGRKLWTMFDSGARNTYVVADVATDMLTWKISPPEPAVLGGKTHKITRECMLIGTIQGLRVRTHARVIQELGKDENERPIDVLFGALAMQEWGIRLVPEEERLDLTHYPKEFVEY